MIQLYAVKEQLKIDSPPAQSSVAIAVSSIQEIMRDKSCLQPPQHLRRRIRAATHDGYQRITRKAARRPRDSTVIPSATMPVILQATRKQKTAYQTLKAAA